VSWLCAGWEVRLPTTEVTGKKPGGFWHHAKEFVKGFVEGAVGGFIAGFVVGTLAAVAGATLGPIIVAGAAIAGAAALVYGIAHGDLTTARGWGRLIGGTVTGGWGAKVGSKLGGLARDAFSFGANKLPSGPGAMNPNEPFRRLGDLEPIHKPGMNPRMEERLRRLSDDELMRTVTTETHG